MTKSSFLFVAVLLGAGATAPSAVAQEKNVHGGRAQVYKQLSENSLEHVTSADALLAEIKHPNLAPTRIWKLLEHGEKVECLGCIPYVKKLLYSSHAKNREISAWWLRRRIFGVFGPGQVYADVVSTLGDQNQSEERRAYAANALGEFLNPSGVKNLAAAVRRDSSPLVRAAAVAALQRMNTEGPDQELGYALSDESEQVRLVVLKAAMAVNVFSSVDAITQRLGDESPLVRRRAAEALGSMRIADAVVGLVALASPDERDAGVRSAAVWALGRIADPAGKAAVQDALDDSDALVRSSAKIALRRL
jgi:HEAT repeat protein